MNHPTISTFNTTQPKTGFLVAAMGGNSTEYLNKIRVKRGPNGVAAVRAKLGAKSDAIEFCTVDAARAVVLALSHHGLHYVVVAA